MIDALRQVIAKLSADLTPLEKDLEKGDKKVSAFESTIKGIGVTIAAAFAGKAIYDFTFGLVHMADQTAKTADTLGLGIVELQEWQHAADLSGVANELLTMSFGKLNLQLNEAATKGTGPAAEALKALGLEAEDANGKLKTSGQIVMEVADAIQGMDVTERNAQLMKLFGEQGAKLVPLLKGGSKGIQEMKDEVEALGFAFDEEFARGAEAFDDDLDRLNKGVRGFVIQAIGPLLPDLVELTGSLVKGAKAVIPMVKGFVQFARETKFLQVALGVLTGKGLLVGAKALGGWITKLGGLRGIMGRVIAVAWKFVAPMLILEDIFEFLSGGKSVLGEKLDEWFGKGTSEKVRDSVNAVGEFIGLFKTAPDIVRRAFGDMADDMRKTIGGWGDFVGGVFANLADYFLFLTDLMTGGWDNAVGKMSAVWDGFKLVFSAAWLEMKGLALTVAAAIADAFAGVWNGVIDGAIAAVTKAGDLASNIPFFGDALAGGAAGAAKSLSGAKMATDSSSVVAADLENARLAIAADYDAIAQRLTASAGGSSVSSQSIENNTQISVTVPPGTPAEVAQSVGNAAARGAAQGTKQNLRATKEALVPSPA